MNRLSKKLTQALVYLLMSTGASFADNQTMDVSPILPEKGLPFRVSIQKANFQLPAGIHSGTSGVYKGLWVFIGGSHIGLHGFGPDPFPPEAQNSTVYVVNPVTGVVLSRSLKEPSSKLTQQQIDTLSVISPQSYQENHTLYMSGGYGVDTASGTLGTKPIFTAINLPGLIQWVTNPRQNSVSANIRQIYNPVFQITGGEMFKSGNVTQLVFGQNFTGVYTPGSNGEYSEQIRQFRIGDSGGALTVEVLNAKPYNPDPNYRRRDLNILPALLSKNNRMTYGLIAYSGVFTETDGIWTVPVVVDAEGNPTMANPASPATFKQGMNNYVSAATGFYSRKHMSMYHLFFGGISYGFYSGGVFLTDSEIPFINQVTTIKRDKNGIFSQYLMSTEYPVILSTQNTPLLFGAGAYFITDKVLHYPNGVINLDSIRKPTVIGYIVGGIASALPNTNTMEDSFGSPYVFKVVLTPI